MILAILRATRTLHRADQLAGQYHFYHVAQIHHLRHVLSYDRHTGCMFVVCSKLECDDRHHQVFGI